jgi:hypothetical protein
LLPLIPFAEHRVAGRGMMLLANPTSAALSGRMALPVP